MMVDPLSHQHTRLAYLSLRVMDPIQRRAALEGAHVVGPSPPQLTVGGHHRALASASKINHNASN
jgi:hypothetical protein